MAPRIWAFVLVLSVAAWPALGVGPAGTIVGAVTDPSGRVVPGAAVTVRNTGTNAQRTVETGAAGEFSVPLLPPGVYEVAVAKNGFRRAVHSDVTLDVNRTIRVDTALDLGDLAEQVTVTEEPPMTQSETSYVGQVIDRRKMVELPLNERNFLGFALLVPGAQLPADGSQNSTQGMAVSVDGAREQSNNYLLDGVDNNDQAINFYSMLPSVDAIQEFQVQSSGSSAEFGRNGGAQINAVLKSGTNELHGTAFAFVRNRHLDAKNFFDQPGAGIPRLDRTQFGGSAGGPLRRDKSFLFVSYEGLRLRQAFTREATVPSQAERQAALAAVPANERNPSGLAILNLYPAANAGPDLAASNRFTGSPVLRNTQNQFLAKWNQNIGARDILIGHYGLFDEDRFNPYDPFFAFTSLPGYGSFSKNRGQNAGLTWIRSFSAHVVNDARFGFNRLRAGIIQESSGTNNSQELGFPNVLSDPATFGYPNVVVAGFDGIGEPINTPQERHDNTFHFADTLAWNPESGGGRHQFKLGADVRRVQMNIFLDFLSRGEWQFLGSFSGNALQDLLRGTPAYAIGVKGDTITGLRTTSQDYFFQDDIRLHSRLTLNLGLRYEYNSPPVDIRDRLSVPDLSPQSAVCSPRPDCQFIRGGTGGVPRATFSGDRNNFAPRAGFAWRPFASRSMVVRSAYGIFHDVAILNLTIGPRFNPPFFSTVLYPNGGTKTIQDILSQPALALPAVPYITAPDYRDGYMQQWNFGVQEEVKPGLVLDLSYVGSKGTHLSDRRNPNQPRPGGTAPYPQFGPFQYFESGASSIYHSLQFRAERRLARSLVFLGSYTWSKSIDNASGIYGTFGEPALPQDSSNMRAERALSDFDARHRFVLSHIYELPFGRGKPWLDSGPLSHIAGNWRLTGVWTFQTGRPFTVNRVIDQSGTGTYLIAPSDRPDQIADPFRAGPVPDNPDPACRLTQSQGGRAADVVREPGSWFNPCAFAPAPGRFGTAGRNSLTGPGMASVDLALLKEVSLRENRRLELRFEAFNAFNHPNFDIPDRVFDSATFGQVRSANAFGNRPPRQIQLGMKYIF